MNCFLVVPKHLTLRFEATNALAAAGYDFLSHYRSVFVPHDLDRLEIHGILEKQTANEIAALLSRLLPFCPHQSVLLKHCGTELSWLVRLTWNCVREGGGR